MPTWSGSCKDLLPVYRLLCPPHDGKGLGSAMGSLLWALIPFMRVPHSWPKHLSKTLPPNTIVHSIRISIYEFGDRAQTFGPKQCLQDLPLDHLFQPQHSPPFPLLLGQWATTSRIDRKGNEINFTFVKMYFSFKEHSTFIYFLLLTQKAHILSPKIAPNRVLLI